MSLLTRMIDAVRPRVTKDTRITPNNPAFIRMFGRGDSDEITDPHSQLPIVYAAIRAVGKVMSQTRLKIMRGEDEVGPGDPVRRLFEKPNSLQSEYEFKESIATNIQVKGNAFIVLDEELVRGIPVGIYGWPARYFTPHYDGDVWTGWDVKRGKGPAKFYPSERVIHVSTYNPGDELLGLAPLDVLKMTYKSMWDALVYNKKFFENDGTPPIIYKSANVLPKDYREQFKKEVMERRRGKAHAHESQLIEGMDVTTLGFTQKDIQFLDLLKRGDEEVLMVFGVTKTQVSKYEDVNYATALSQDKVFISNTCIPLMRQVESEINSQWLSKIGYSVRFDERSNEAMMYLSAEEAQKVVSIANSRLITVNEGREMLGIDPVDWGDDVPQPVAAPSPVLPAAPVVPAKPVPPREETKAAAPVVLDDAIGKARRANTWNALNNLIKPVEVKCAQAVRRYFFDAEKRVLDAVKAKMAGGAIVKVADPDIDNAFSDEKLYSLLRRYLGQSIAMGADTLGVPDVNIGDPGINQYLSDRVQYIKGINDTAKESLKEKLHDTLEQAMADKLTEEQRTEAVRKVLSEGFGQLKSHARSIARTEVHGAFAEGRWEACEQINPTEIEWVSSRDPFVRDSHAALDGKRVRFGETFANGCKRPLDPAGGAAEVINCRCNFQIHI